MYTNKNSYLFCSFISYQGVSYIIFMNFVTLQQHTVNYSVGKTWGKKATEKMQISVGVIFY